MTKRAMFDPTARVVLAPGTNGGIVDFANGVVAYLGTDAPQFNIGDILVVDGVEV